MTARKCSTSPDDRPRQISYNVRQAAEATGISESRLRMLVRHGHLAARYLGSTILIDAESLARLYRSLPSERPVDRECAANRDRRTTSDPVAPVSAYPPGGLTGDASVDR